MKYLMSARKSLSTFYFTPSVVNMIEKIGAAIYIFIMVVLWLVDICSYPNNDNPLDYINWLKTKGHRVLQWTHWVWLILNLCNMTIIFTSIMVLFVKV